MATLFLKSRSSRGPLVLVVGLLCTQFVFVVSLFVVALSRAQFVLWWHASCWGHFIWVVNLSSL